MKSLITSVLLLVSLTLVGCMNPTSASNTAEKLKSPAAVRIITSSGASLAMANNPSYVPAAQAIVAGIDAVVTGDSLLTADIITRFVSSICVQRGMSPTEAVVFTSLARNAYIAYVEDFDKTDMIVTTGDPNVQLYLVAFKNGLNDALAVIQATVPAN